MILKDECHKIGISVAEFSRYTEVPVQTLRDWCKSRPKLIQSLVLGLQAIEILARVDILNADLKKPSLAHGSD